MTEPVVTARLRTDRPGTAPALELRGVLKAFRQGGVALTVLNGVDLALRPGEIAALVGPSGAGKSTLLHVTGLLERPDSGAVMIGGRDCGGLSDAERTLLRRRALGFVYQFHHLLPEFSALENVMLPQMIAGVARSAARRKAEMLLGRVGLAERLGHRPARLSGGEQQRVAIVRALANDPQVLLADEPTGNLDAATGETIIDLMFELNRERRATLLLVTHDESLSLRCGRILRLAGGMLQKGAG